MAISRTAGPSFSGTDAQTRTTSTFNTSAGDLVVVYVGVNTGGATTVSWSGGTPAGATAFVSLGEAVNSARAALWAAITSSAQTGVAVVAGSSDTATNVWPAAYVRIYSGARVGSGVPANAVANPVTTGTGSSAAALSITVQEIGSVLLSGFTDFNALGTATALAADTAIFNVTTTGDSNYAIEQTADTSSTGATNIGASAPAGAVWSGVAIEALQDATFATAFQGNAFQGNAFQIYGGSTGAPTLALLETAVLSDLLGVNKVAEASDTETITVGEAMSIARSSAIDGSETISVGDAVALARSAGISVAESITVGDAVALARLIGLTEVEGVVLSESLDIAISAPTGDLTLAETVIASDSQALQLAGAKGIAETAVFGESLAFAIATAGGASLSEAAVFGEALAFAKSIAMGISETVVVLDYGAISGGPAPVGPVNPWRRERDRAGYMRPWYQRWPMRWSRGRR